MWKKSKWIPFLLEVDHSESREDYVLLVGRFGMDVLGIAHESMLIHCVGLKDAEVWSIPTCIGILQQQQNRSTATISEIHRNTMIEPTQHFNFNQFHITLRPEDETSHDKTSIKSHVVISCGNGSSAMHIHSFALVCTDTGQQEKNPQHRKW